MTRFLRAWAWLRWRTFMNAIERSDRADRIARFSRALEALGPVLVAVMMIPSAIAAMLLGMATGFGLATGEVWGEPLMYALRVVLFLVIVFVVLGPIMLPSGRGIGSLPRLLLLPVSHKTLFAGEMLGGLAEPWTLLGAVAVLMVPIGALIAGSAGLAFVTAIGALLLVAALIALGAFFGALLHILLRDRSRGEWIVVLVFTLLPLAALAPTMIAGAAAGQKAEDWKSKDWEEAFESRMGAMLEHPANGALAIFPGEMFAAVAARSAGVSPGRIAIPLLALGAAAAGATAGGWMLWKRTIARGGVARGRSKSQRAASGAPSSLRMMKTPLRGIAYSFLQHVVRTTRGKTIVLPSLIIAVVLAVLVGARGGMRLGPFPLRDGFAVAVFGVVMAFLTIVQLWMNQFAIDKAGLTMLCVQPLSGGQILRGKMAGAAVLVIVLSALPILAGLIIGGSVHPIYWLVLTIGGVAGFLVLAPVAALLSAIFPKFVDMSSIGQKSNAHPAAGLLGGILILAAAAPTAGAAIAGSRVFHSPWAALALTIGWLIVALVLHWALWKLAVATFERRREALMAVATGR